MGGIPTNYHGEVVTLKDGNPDAVVPGLFAIGEAACVSSTAPTVSVPTASSIWSSSAARPATGSRDHQVGRGAKAAAEGLGGAGARALDHFRHAKGGSPTSQIRAAMQKTMQADCAVFRTEETLRRAGQDRRVYRRMATSTSPTAASSGTPTSSRRWSSTICSARRW
jgi:succinate dehydrogenase / fumarate reductase flavoprotein subunit